MSTTLTIDTRRSLLTTLLERAHDQEVDDDEGRQLASLFYKESRAPELQPLYTYAMTIPRFKRWTEQASIYNGIASLKEAVCSDDASNVMKALSSTAIDEETRTRMAILCLLYTSPSPRDRS